MDKDKRIIIVEDDRDFRESIVEYLVLAGFEVTGVESALEFYRSISQQHFKVVILDIGLPDQNGLVLAEYVRNNTDMRIVMLTAQSGLESRISAYEAGADIYLIKPIDFAELSASLKSILGRIDAQEPVKQEAATEPVPMVTEAKTWTLVRSDWALLTPEGSDIRLTAKEFDFIERIAQSPKTVVLRHELLTILDYENNEYGNRALDALIHRLRRKNEGARNGIPVKTVHGSGYCFSAPVVIV
jgi:DNA-binding response OmpR family regulator